MCRSTESGNFEQASSTQEQESVNIVCGLAAIELENEVPLMSELTTQTLTRVNFC